MITKSTDLLARLLAQENISVAHVRARTASFNIKSRVLSLPNWKDMTPEILDLMVFHEVGHALWTTNEYVEFLSQDGHMKYRDILNVIEDARIEKLIKEQFPGVRKMFTEGYKQLEQKDFFGVPKAMYNSMSFLDRINLYYKIGIDSGITFNNAEEKQFIDRINRLKTVKEIFELAVEIYEYCKAEKDAKTAQQHEFVMELDEEDMQDAYDDGFEDDSEDEDGSWGYDDEPDNTEDGVGSGSALNEDDTEPSGKKQMVKRGTVSEDDEVKQDEDIKSITQQSLHSKLEESADESTTYTYWNYKDLPYDPLVSYKSVLSNLNSFARIDEQDSNNAKKFMAETSAVVNYLAKEFELKKSADLYKRTLEAKSGDIDLKKLYAYKLKDDLFRKIKVVPNAKNHGMVMLLDWSGSMSNHMTDTLKQVINLSMFCRKVQIPFQVLAFTDRAVSFGHSNHREVKSYLPTSSYNNPNETSLPIDKFSLLELFSDKMSTKDFNDMVKFSLSGYLYQAYVLYGTPLIESTAYMIEYIKKFQSSRNIQKMTFLTLTDGEGSTIHHRLSSFEYENGQKITRKHFLVGKNSKKNFVYGNEYNIQMKATLELLKEETGATVLGFFLGTTSSSTLRSFVTSNLGVDLNSYSYTDKHEMIFQLSESIKKDIRTNKYAAITGTGRDMLFYIPVSSTKISNEELVVEGNKSARALSSLLSKHINKQKTSRVLLSHFIDFIA